MRRVSDALGTVARGYVISCSLLLAAARRTAGRMVQGALVTLGMKLLLAKVLLRPEPFAAAED